MERRHDIDWLRVIAIGLLLIYHVAIIFQPWAMFIGFIRSDELMESLWKPMTMLNVWRIPLLFYVSGMGVYFAMRKRVWTGLNEIYLNRCYSAYYKIKFYLCTMLYKKDITFFYENLIIRIKMP